MNASTSKRVQQLPKEQGKGRVGGEHLRDTTAKKFGKCEDREYNKRRIWVVSGSTTSEKTWPGGENNERYLPGIQCSTSAW